jgi:hypothetical protein
MEGPPSAPLFAGGPRQEGKDLMSDLQGPRIPGEEGSGRGRRLGWIIAALIALLLLALLVPFACQALTGGSEPQGGASGTQENAAAQGGDEAGSGGEAGGDGNAGSDGNAAGSESTEDNGGGEVAAAQESTNASDENGSQDRGTAEGSDRGAADRAGGGGADDPLPETGGAPVVLFAAGTSLVMVAACLLALVRRQSAERH